MSKEINNMGKVLPMSQAVGELTRIGKTTCIDEAGNKIRTHSGVKNPGAGQGTLSGKPKAFSTPEDLIDTFSDFIEHVRLNEYSIYPTKANFARYLQITPRTVYNTLEIYFPEIKKMYIDMLSDCLTEGASLGKYEKTMTIFCLKNWCNWADKQENVNTEIKPKLADKATADKLIKQYTERQK